MVPSSNAGWLCRQLGGGRHGIAEAQAALMECCPTERTRRLGVPEQSRTIYSSIADGAALRLWVRVYDRPGPWLGRAGPLL